MKRFILLSLLLIAAVSGCVSQTTIGSGIAVKAQLNPPKMYSDSVSTLYIDVENQDISSVDAYAEVFDTGILQALDECRAEYQDFLPREIRTAKCMLKAPSADQLTKDSITTNINYKVIFSKLFSAPVIFKIIGYEEFAKQQEAGLIKYGQQTQSFSDPNAAISIEFSKQPPFVARPGEKVFMYIKIRSLGTGFLQDIDEENFIIEDSEGILSCDFPTQVQQLTAIKREFPPITCELNMPYEQNYLRDFIIIIKYNYNYEYRDSIAVVVNR